MEVRPILVSLVDVERNLLNQRREFITIITVSNMINQIMFSEMFFDFLSILFKEKPKILLKLLISRIL